MCISAGVGLVRIFMCAFEPFARRRDGQVLRKKCSGGLRRTHRRERPERATAFHRRRIIIMFLRVLPLRRSPYAAVNRSPGSGPVKCNVSRIIRELEPSGGEGMHMLLQLVGNLFADFGPEAQVGLPDRTAAKNRPAGRIYPNSFRTSPNEKSLGTSSSPMAV